MINLISDEWNNNQEQYDNIDVYMYTCYCYADDPGFYVTRIVSLLIKDLSSGSIIARDFVIEFEACLMCRKVRTGSSSQ